MRTSFQTCKLVEPGQVELRRDDALELVVSVEEHSVIGGLGGAIAELLSGAALDGKGTPAPLLRLGTKDVFGESGVADELLEKHRLTGPAIAEDVLKAL